MEWLAGLIGLVVGFFFGALIVMVAFITMLAQNGLAMKGGKIMPIKSTDPVLVINFPATMDEDQAQRVLADALMEARTTGIQEVEEMVEGILRRGK